MDHAIERIADHPAFPFPGCQRYAARSRRRPVHHEPHRFVGTDHSDRPAAATISSAIGSILIAPRTLQALARDKVLPSPRLNAVLSRGRGKEGEPVNATLASAAIALVFVMLGDVNFVAKIISMFFMVTYGALCTVSFLEHFAGNLSYRPSFRSRSYVSLLGAFMCFMMMFQMAPGYAVLALLIMFGIYRGLRYRRQGERDLSAICHRHGFGQFIQYIEGRVSVDSEVYSRVISEKLIQRTEASHAGVFVDSIVAESFGAALAQAVQMPVISGLPNNTVLFEFSRNHAAEIGEVAAGAKPASPLGFNVCILRSSEIRFGYRGRIHIWLTKDDFTNARSKTQRFSSPWVGRRSMGIPLMILLAYIILGHPEWRQAEISILYPADTMEKELATLHDMITEGRLPIAKHNLTPVRFDDQQSFERACHKSSRDADLVIMGFVYSDISSGAKQFLLSHIELSEVLFVNANEQISISQFT